MQWFAGNVQTAIQISRKNQALLVVYVTNDSEDVRLFDSFWDQVEPANLICPIVGIKLKDGETAAQQFSDIYPTPILPAAYLINQSGEPLEVITPLVGKEYDQFRAKFNKAVEQFVKTTPKVANSGAVVVPTSSEAPAASPAPQPVSAAAAPIDPNLAEKVARAKELLKIKKQKEEEQRRIQEKTQKEEMMKAQKTRQEHEDKALMEAAKQRKKEKLEAGKEKERILAQIKADRENAKKKFGKPAENPENSTTEAEKKPSDSVGKSIPSDRCRLQVRLPDGSIFVEEFPSNDVLNSLVEIIRQKPVITGSFEVSQTYPRRVFSLEDYSKSFLDNKLTPSSALVVVLKPSTTAKASSAIVTTSSSVFTLLFSPVLLIWNLLSGWFGGMAATGSAAAAKKSENSTGTGGPQNPGAGRARGMPRVAEVRRRGNVAGLENPNDDDPEERANFNGNSTQFM